MARDEYIASIANRLVGDIARRTGAGVLAITAQCRAHYTRTGFVTTGCHLTLANGRTLSVQWGDGNYSNVGRGAIDEGEEPEVEIALLDTDGTFISIDDSDTVMPYVPLSIAHDVIAKYSEET